MIHRPLYVRVAAQAKSKEWLVCQYKVVHVADVKQQYDTQSDSSHRPLSFFLYIKHFVFLLLKITWQ